MSYHDLQVDEVEDELTEPERDTDGGDTQRDRHERLAREHDHAVIEHRRRTAFGD